VKLDEVAILSESLSIKEILNMWCLFWRVFIGMSTQILLMEPLSNINGIFSLV